MVAQKMRLSEVADIITGITNSDVNGPFQYFYYQPNSFSESGTVVELSKISRNEPVSERQLIRIGDVLVKRLNPNFPLFISELLGESVISTNLYVIRAKSGTAPEYLAFLFEQSSVLIQIAQFSGANSVIKAISVNKLKDVMIPVLPFEQQELVGKWWNLVKRRKQLMASYLAETDRLVAAKVEEILM